MAPPTRRRHPARTLITLAVLVAAVFAAIFAGTKWSDATWSPKLALDLEGGTQLILAPVAEDASSVSSETINQAIQVIRQRVDSSGVAEAEITSQGGSNIVVALPGRPSEETLDLVRTSAQMEFRPVLTYAAPQPTTADGATEAPTDGATDAATADPSAAPEATPAPTDAATGDASADGVVSGTVPGTAATDDPTEPTAEATEPATDGAAGPTSPSDAAYYITPEVEAAFAALDCTDPNNLTGGQSGPADEALVTCDPDGTVKYILGPIEVEGARIANASSGLQVTSTGAVTNRWAVNLEFDSEGTTQFRDVTERLQGLQSPQNQFAIVLDGLVISAPSLDPGVIISDGKAEISGTFTRDSATALANQLKFGALPLSFDVQSEEQISATLGSEQLEKGLLAGLLGLLLVVVFSLVLYRALGLVTVASLGIAAVLTYGVITLLSWTQGYRLSLPGVAGLIVAIGITADSFIVYFERIRDELREGRTLVAAVDRGWERARRTILASDAVNFLAAVVLYFLAVGSVRGFAFTLGLTTLIDLVVVFLFTHPVMLLLARTKFFGQGHRLSGLDPKRLGATGGTRYVGRGRFVTEPKPGATGAASLDAPTSTLVAAVPGAGGTIAERRAAARAAEAQAAAGEQPAEEGAVATDDAVTDTSPPDDPGASGTGDDVRTEGKDA
ncbi:protein translocase subunit SecD [Cellulomonas triticagri]|uniref:Protein translocase subunit SecD n=1 Tax=Cellulomonas triticagri TaxID=2483352 RepID=A0A3M2JML5_9CELL|nr:protein translocase subunit SecD [Cellulomonas triticagri]RMI13516.1 protein translocase subunit SecD [Cellulomonas triticagri]